MLTGTDISIAVCRAEGYAVVEHHGNRLDPYRRYRCTVSNPTAWTDNGKRRPFYRNAYVHDERVSYSDLWDRFQKGGKGVKDFCDFETCPFPTPHENPSFEEMAALFGIVTGYGL